jgi:hypothetical protein
MYALVLGAHKFYEVFLRNIFLPFEIGVESLEFYSITILNHTEAVSVGNSHIKHI